MGNNRKWYSMLLIGLALLLASSVIGCAPSYTEADLDAARQAASEAGYSQGASAGYDEGYTEGHGKGYEAGTAGGYVTGYKAGHEAGHDKGYNTGHAQGYEAGLLEGNKAGYAEGYEAGLIESESFIQEAEKFGYDKGYEAGIAAAQQSAGAKRAEEEAERKAAMARLDDLAYISALLSSYTDDADRESDGINLMISFYDSKSERIYVNDVPITVNFKLYNVSGETTRPTKGYDPLIYEDTVSINSTTERIKISYEQLYGSDFVRARSSAPTLKFMEKWLEVTVTTPNQEVFSITDKTGWILFGTFSLPE